MSRNAADKAASHVRSLDGVRAVAAYSVIATHAGFNTGRSLDNGVFAPLLARLDFGVTLFFLLSGFLLFRPFARATIDQVPYPRVIAFWWRRGLRIVPAYWLAVIVTLTLLSVRRTGAADWCSYLLLVQSYDGHNVDASLTQMWTLSVEVSFYAALPILAALIRLLARRFGAMYANLLLIVVLMVAASASNVVTHAVGGPLSSALLWLPNYLDWFGLGMLMAVVSCSGSTLPARLDAIRAWANAPGLCWAIGAMLLWLATLPIAGPRNLATSTGWEWTFRHTLYGTTAFFLLLPVVLGQASTIGRLLGNPTVAWLGTISYGVYLWHLPLLLAIQRWMGWSVFRGHFFALYILTALAATAAATLSWYLLERPLLTHFSRSWHGRVQRNDEQRNSEQADDLRRGVIGKRVR